MRQRTALLSFNRGLLSRLGLARIDLNRTALSAEVQTNWMPRVLGSMSLRPGLGHLGSPAGKCHMLPFIFAADDKALIEFSDSVLRVWVDDELVTRVAVSSAITGGTFAGSIDAAWVDSDEGASVSAFATGGFLSLVGTGADAGKRIQAVSVAPADQGVRHALRIVIERGPVTLRVGSTSDGDEYITESVLGTGTHSLAFTPTGDTFYVSLSNRNIPAALVDSVAIEAAGIMRLPTPWGLDDLANLRTDQSADVVFVACLGFQQRKIERRAVDSWSIVLYQSDTGPFMNENITPVTIAPSNLNGDITLTASKPLFKSTNVGSLYRITSSGQTVTATLSGDNQFTDPIRVTGIDAQRIFAVILGNIVDSTVTLQYSVAAPGSWVDAKQWTSDTSESYDDGLDNQLIYYRIGIKAGDYGSDSITATLVYSSGSITGVARVTSYTSTTVVNAAVLTDFGATTASTEWWESFWSERRGFPSAVTFFEGRLWWFGKGWVFGSISDQYEDYDDFFEGDAGPIIRSIARGPIDTLHWAIDLDNLVFGSVSSEIAAHSNTQDDPLTPSNFQLKDVTTQGSSAVDVVKIDQVGVFVQRSGQRVIQLAFNPSNSISYEANDLTIAVPDLNAAGIVQMAVQRKPDTRIHCVRSDGTAAVLVMDRAENVAAWIEIETRGDIEDVSVLPDTEEDAVYYVVNRGSGRFLERWALESECRGGLVNKQADSFVLYDDVLTTSIPVAHLDNGTNVIAWADGIDVGGFDVVAGAITLATEARQVVVGLGYSAEFQSTKLGNSLGTPLNLKKRITSIGLVLADTHAQGITFGPDFDHLDSLPLIEQGATVDPDSVHEDYDEQVIPFNGNWNTDSRICLTATAPRPCTVLAASITMAVSD